MRHNGVTIPLDRSHWKEKGKLYYQAPRSPEIVKWLREFMKKDLAKLERCPNCGGILPELVFMFEGKEYWFTCTKIRQNDKVVARTDYQKFAKYCMKHMESEKKE